MFNPTYLIIRILMFENTNLELMLIITRLEKIVFWFNKQSCLFLV